MDLRIVGNGTLPLVIAVDQTRRIRRRQAPWTPYRNQRARSHQQRNRLRMPVHHRDEQRRRSVRGPDVRRRARPQQHLDQEHIALVRRVHQRRPALAVPAIHCRAIRKKRLRAVDIPRHHRAVQTVRSRSGRRVHRCAGACRHALRPRHFTKTPQAPRCQRLRCRKARIAQGLQQYLRLPYRIGRRACLGRRRFLCGRRLHQRPRRRYQQRQNENTVADTRHGHIPFLQAAAHLSVQPNTDAPARVNSTRRHQEKPSSGRI